MEIIVNGFTEKVEPGTSLAELIERFEAGDSSLIVEVNGRFVHDREYATREIQAGDRVELIHPAFGG